MAIGTFSVGDTITAAWLNSVAGALNGRFLGTVNTNTSVTSTGTTEALFTALALTVTGIDSTLNYFIEFGWKWVTSVAGDTAWGGIHASQSAITTASPVVAQVQKYVPLTAGNMDEHTYRVLWQPGANGSWNLQAGVKRANGTGNSQITSGQQNAFLTIVQA